MFWFIIFGFASNGQNESVVKVAMRALGFEVKKVDVMTIVKDFDRGGTGKITYEIFKEVGRVPVKFSTRADHLMQKEAFKNPTISSQALLVSLATVGVKVNASTIRKRLYKFDLHGRCVRKKPLLSKKNIRARVQFANEHIGKDQAFWNNALWTDESKIELLGNINSRHSLVVTKDSFSEEASHTNCEARWCICYGLGLLRCHRDWTACIH
ncbi:centrin-3 isoform X3 [Ictalurus punctatus]|uniref:Centrin-3 isoform X3 n=1 Tax=Ictalurus punctatus TaxID=7998 RepID=A0A979E5U6_ICTPU|nr:centrin-3 isoform X3 [Ictalurus punctatus]